MSRPEVDAALAGRLVAAQFPEWAHLPVRPVTHGGWDNRTFRLGETMVLRIPSHGRYAPAVEKEQAWLPTLAPHLPLPIPAPLARGEPGELYPLPWSVCRWLPGESAASAPPEDEAAFAADLGIFLRALHAVDTAGGPPAGHHSFFRGGDLAVYDGEVRAALEALAGRIDTVAVRRIWEAALAGPVGGPPVWVHGDVAPGNLLVRQGRLSAVIDFGQLAVGDPACDLAIGWTTFGPAGRAAFRAAVPLDPSAWARGRGWALWKAAIVVAGLPGTDPATRDAAARTLEAVLADGL